MCRSDGGRMAALIYFSGLVTGMMLVERAELVKAPSKANTRRTAGETNNLGPGMTVITKHYAHLNIVEAETRCDRKTVRTPTYSLPSTLSTRLCLPIGF